jgi:hypothetical protein
LPLKIGKAVGKADRTAHKIAKPAQIAKEKLLHLTKAEVGYLFSSPPSISIFVRTSCPSTPVSSRLQVGQRTNRPAPMIGSGT